jgi:hypothetical protein
MNDRISCTDLKELGLNNRQIDALRVMVNEIKFSPMNYIKKPLKYLIGQLYVI